MCGIWRGMVCFSCEVCESISQFRFFCAKGAERRAFAILQKKEVTASSDMAWKKIFFTHLTLHTFDKMDYNEVRKKLKGGSVNVGESDGLESIWNKLESEQTAIIQLYVFWIEWLYVSTFSFMWVSSMLTVEVRLILKGLWMVDDKK